uniref:F-box domain-containing protein n=1 Tax=Caenorhabditis tropicalis TaxID=1561998 RepID=A0A1I7UN08_9PELO
MSFHLFNLPESIYIDIINTMNPCEQFFTSLCSRKTYSIIKTHRSEIEYSRILTYGNSKFDFGHYADTFLTFHQSPEPPNQVLKELTIDGNTIPYELKEDKVVTTYWAEPREGTMKLIEYVSDLFNIEVRDMEIHCNSTDRLMKWVQNRQKRLQKVYFTPDTLKSLIMACEAESIFLDAYTTNPLQIQNFQKKCDFFSVSVGIWFTLDNLMTLDCIEVWVMGRQYTSEEINRFIKHWMSGGSPRLTLLVILLDNYNEQELMDGIDVKWNMKTVHIR